MVEKLQAKIKIWIFKYGIHCCPQIPSIFEGIFYSSSVSSLSGRQK